MLRLWLVGTAVWVVLSAVDDRGGAPVADVSSNAQAVTIDASITNAINIWPSWRQPKISSIEILPVCLRGSWISASARSISCCRRCGSGTIRAVGRPWCVIIIVSRRSTSSSSRGGGFWPQRPELRALLRVPIVYGLAAAVLSLLRKPMTSSPASSAEAIGVPGRRSTPWICRFSMTSGGVAASSFASSFTKAS